MNAACCHELHSMSSLLDRMTGVQLFSWRFDSQP